MGYSAELGASAYIRQCYDGCPKSINLLLNEIPGYDPILQNTDKWEPSLIEMT